MSVLTSNGICVDAQIVSPPPSSGTTANASGSIGTGARRWFMNRARTTTSAPAKTSSSQSLSKRCATFVPIPGNNRGAVGSAAATGSVTTSSGSASSHSTSAASSACAAVSATTRAYGSPTNRTRSRASTSRWNGSVSSS